MNNRDSETGKLSTVAHGSLLTSGSTINRNGIKGKIPVVGWVGERYYWRDCGGVAAMIPAVDLED